MKQNEPFYVGTTNVYDYQAQTGVKRFNTLQASQRETQPGELEVAQVQSELGLDLMQARNHVRCRMWLRKLKP